jgi:predicted NBD/HSP70 family sugar kinase
MPVHSAILKQLQTTPTSLADLQPVAQVSLPTLRKAVQELSDTRWIRVVGQSEANGGRPAMLFGLDDTHYVILGVHLQLPGMRMILSDLTGTMLDESETFHKALPHPDEVVQTIAEYAAAARERYSDREILGVGIAAPGFTDPVSGDIISIGRVSGWQNFPICQRLDTMLGVPVKIANDVDCMAFAEFQHTRKPFDRNLAYFGFDEGVKVSMFLNGALYKGSFGNAGLITPQRLRIEGVDLSPDDQRRMLTISGIGAIFREKVDALPKSERRAYTVMLDAGDRKRLKLILAGAADDLPVCREIAGTLNAVLSTAVAHIVHVIQPDIIVIGGALSAMPQNLFSQLSAAIRGQLPPLFANRASIEQARLTSANSAAQGANYHFLERLLLDDTVEIVRSVRNGGG